MRRLILIALLFALATPAQAAKHRPRKHKPVTRAKSVARPKSGTHRPRRVRLGLTPHHKGVSNLFWMTKPIPSDRPDPAMDYTAKKSIPLN